MSDGNASDCWLPCLKEKRRTVGYSVLNGKMFNRGLKYPSGKLSSCALPV